jgi:hypothetical protein
MDIRKPLFSANSLSPLPSPSSLILLLFHSQENKMNKGKEGREFSGLLRGFWGIRNH